METFGRVKNYWIIYALKLEDNCWYIGQTTQKAFKARMNRHWKGKASKWTTLHKPIRQHHLEIYPRSLTTSEAAKLEDRLTEKYILSFGVQYVRGGGFCQIDPKYYHRNPRNKKLNKNKNKLYVAEIAYQNKLGRRLREII